MSSSASGPISAGVETASWIKGSTCSSRDFAEALASAKDAGGGITCRGVNGSSVGVNEPCHSAAGWLVDGIGWSVPSSVTSSVAFSVASSAALRVVALSVRLSAGLVSSISISYTPLF